MIHLSRAFSITATPFMGSLKLVINSFPFYQKRVREPARLSWPTPRKCKIRPHPTEVGPGDARPFKEPAEWNALALIKPTEVLC